jgi:hypothetical protein
MPKKENFMQHMLLCALGAEMLHHQVLQGELLALLVRAVYLFWTIEMLHLHE